VREQQNAVERLLALGLEGLSGLEGPEVAKDFQGARESAIRAFEKTYLSTLLERHGGSAAAAMKEAGIARSYFYRLLDEHGLKRR
jgi:DNA-binding NtrC family response regulator